MKTSLHFIGICAACLSAIAVANAQVPHMISYQGRAKTSAGTPFTGTGMFRFALVSAGAADTYWSNDGTTGAGLFPSTDVPLSVNNGVYAVYLGATLPGMTANIPPSIFTNSQIFLRVWFSDGSVSPVLTTPDTRIVSAGYAMIAAEVVDHSITEAKLADDAVTSRKMARGAIEASSLASGAVTTEKLADSAVTSEKLAEQISLGGGSSAGLLEVRPASLIAQGITLDASAGSVTTSDAFVVAGLFKTHALLGVESSRGILKFYDEDEDEVAWLGATESAGGELKLYQSDGETRGVTVIGDASGGNSGGLINVMNPDGEKAVTIDGDAGSDAGGILIYQADGSTEGVSLKGDAEDGGGLIILRQNDDDIGVYIDGNDDEGAGFLSIRNSDGHASIQLFGAESATDDGGQILLYNSNQTRTVQIDGDAPNSEGWIGLYRTNKTEAAIQLDAYDADGKGRITTEVLEITGGSDLSENFDITVADDLDAPQPGLIVCIDPDSPGHLMVSSKAYDRTVAGIVSGAGGVKPGMLMGQHGTAANGKHPVALTGRVYCMADASNGAIQPGDLLTTSGVPGHAMKVTDHARAQGAIIGKAMTPLGNDRGLVLVLVCLQ